MTGNIVFVVLVLVSIIGVAGVSLWLGRRLQKATQAQEVAEARQRMEETGTFDTNDTLKRMRRGEF